QWRNRRSGVGDLQRAAQPGGVPRAGDPQVGRERPGHLAHGRRERVEHRQIHAVRRGAHRQRVGELTMLHAREGEVQRQKCLHVEDLLPRAPEVQGVRSRRSRYSKVPSTNGARNSPSRPLESENAPLDTGLARLPERPAVAVTDPPTPAVSRSSSAYTPASGKPSSCRWASARPCVGRPPSSASLPDPYTLCSTRWLTRAAESVTLSCVGRSSTH